MNTARRGNILFLIIVILSILANVAVSYLSVRGIELNIRLSIILSQVIILIPGLIYFVIQNKHEEILRPYRKIKPVNILLAIVLTGLISPLTMSANIFSQLFTENELVNISGSVLELPLLESILIIGILGPMCEEFVFRGLIYNSLKGKGRRYIASGLVSGLFFGLLHLNFNQFCYAVLLGIIFALVNECLESIWVSTVCHAAINTSNVIYLYEVENFYRTYTGKGISDVYADSLITDSGMSTKLIYVILLYILLIVSVVTTVLALLLLRGMCGIEGKADRFNMVFRPKKYRHENMVSEGVDSEAISKERILYISGIVAILICVFVMFGLEPLKNMIK